MQFEEQTAGVTEGLTLGITAPQWCGLSEAVGTGGWPIVLITVLGATRARRSGRNSTAESRLWRGVWRCVGSIVHALAQQLVGVRRRRGTSNLLTTRVLLAVAHFTDRGCGSVRAAKTAALVPLTGSVHHVCRADRDMFPVLHAESRQGVERSRELTVPVQAVHVAGVVITKVGGHSQASPLGVVVGIIIFVVRIRTE